MAIQTPQHPNALRMYIESAGYSFREISKETNIPERTLYDWAADITLSGEALARRAHTRQDTARAFLKARAQK